MNKRFIFSISTVLALSLVFSSAEAGKKGKKGKKKANQQVEEPAPLAPIMNEPLDGESVESFELGVEKVKTEAGEAEFMSLNNALGYFLVYDISLGGDKEKLYTKMDGKTPAEIIDKHLTRQGIKF